MKTRHIIHIFAAALALAACSDTWDEHYPEAGQQPENSSPSLWNAIEANPNLSDFARIARHTHLYNNMHITPVTYADLLASDQTLTVWAPLNGTFNADSLMEMCQTSHGDSLAGMHFIANHIANFIYNSPHGDGKTTVKMLNNKLMPFTSTQFGGIPLTDSEQVKPSRNGQLHTIASAAPFSYNIYEGLTSVPSMNHIGSFLLRFERHELDEKLSQLAYIDNGRKVYSDSVMTLRNILFDNIGSINCEDSSYAMLVPNEQLWNEALAEAMQHFNYGKMENADSLQRYWANMVLLRDLIFNQNEQTSLADSMFTTAYSTDTWPYHVFHKPYAEGGVLSSDVVARTTSCSNGTYYHLSKWPFTREDLYYQYIKVEAEEGDRSLTNVTKLESCNIDPRGASADSISGSGYVSLTGNPSSRNWKAEFKIDGTLSATYDVCAVILPKQVYNIFSTDHKPNAFKAQITYTAANGDEKTERITERMQNDPYRVDTVFIKRITLPVAGFGLTNNPTVRVQIECSVANSELTKYSREMYLDCIYLRPVKKEDTK